MKDRDWVFNTFKWLLRFEVIVLTPLTIIFGT